MEASALEHPPLHRLRGASPLLRLADDARLIDLTRRGNQAAFETIVSRYQTRLLGFCRHMLSSREDAEDILQEVFAAAFNAIQADRRPINTRPWLYRIARNRCLNHLRRQTAIGVDSMDIHLADHGQSTTDKVAKREDFRLLMTDVSRLPETQRTALLLREIDSLSYDGIAEAMETTVPSVKSLLVRARVSLAEAAESRRLTCEEVRLELGAVAEGIAKLEPPTRRHVKACDRCRNFQGQLRQNNRALAAILPVGPLLLIKKFALAKVGLSCGAGSATGGGAAAGAATAASCSAAGSGAALTGGALATKAVASLAAAALVTAGAEVAVHHVPFHPHHSAIARIAAVPAPPPTVTESIAQPVSAGPAKPATQPPVKPAVAPATAAVAPATAATTPPATTIQQVSATSVLPPQRTGTPPPISTGPGNEPSAHAPPASVQTPDALPPSQSVVPAPGPGLITVTG